MNQNKSLILIICAAILLFNLFLISRNPDCPFHVDYVQYTTSISNFYEKGIIEGSVNGKHIYIYIMSIFLMPFNLLNLKLYNGMVFVTGIFQILLVYLFYRYTDSVMKTLLMATTLTFLTFIGHAETAIISSVFLLLYFMFRDKPYSEFFIAIASFIRIDSAIYYLFARKWTSLIPMTITFLQWLNMKYFVHSDFGINNAPFSVMLILLASYGTYLILLFFLAKPKNKPDFIIHIFIVAILILFLESPSQKVFFFPVMLSFMLYDFDFAKLRKYAIIPFIIINVGLGLTIQLVRAEHCTPQSVHQFAIDHIQVFYGVFQPYLDYYNMPQDNEYTYQLTTKCKNATDYFMAEDWRNSQILYWPYKFCLEEYNADHTS